MHRVIRSTSCHADGATRRRPMSCRVVTGRWLLQRPSAERVTSELLLADGNPEETCCDACLQVLCSGSPKLGLALVSLC